MTLVGARIGLLTASASRQGGGVSEAVVRHAAMVRALGAQPIVVALHDAFTAADRTRYGDAELHALRVSGPSRIGYAPGLIGTLTDLRLDLLHLHGIWMYPSRAGTRWTQATGRPYIVSPHGMLDPWITARGRWKKRVARLGYERRSWASAATLHALTADEATDIERESGRRDAVVVPNAAPRCSAARTAGGGVLYLGRLHHKKNLTALIRGWTQAVTGDAVLTIAGWGDAVEVAAVELAVAAAGPNVRFIGPVHGTAKQTLLEATRWLILPSLSEGLPMVVLEAWAAGTPAIMTAACHLPEGEACGAALTCSATAAGIAATLTAAIAEDDARWRRRSIAAQALAAGPFSPAAVADRWVDIYRGLLS